jgi:hypothetical protein
MGVELIVALAPLVAALAPLVAQWILRRWAKKNDPKTQIQKEKDENREAIASGTAGGLLESRINRLPPNKGA